jgi:hypothetical protein
MERLIIALVALAFLAAPALADDLYPPSWRGSLDTTFEHWTFDTDQYPTWLPEQADNPYGQPYIHTLGGGEHWDDSLPGDRFGIMTTSSDTVCVELPNVPTQNDWKLVYVQMTWWHNAPPDPISDPPGQVNLIQELSLPTAWGYSSWEIWIPGNPPSETVSFVADSATLYMDQLVVDTICIPEPASLLLFGLAGLCLLRRLLGERR